MKNDEEDKSKLQKSDDRINQQLARQLENEDRNTKWEMRGGGGIDIENKNQGGRMDDQEDTFRQQDDEHNETQLRLWSNPIAHR